MTDSHHVIISSYPLDDKFSQLDISCSCGETLLSGMDEISVDEANNIRWQHLVKYMTPIPPQPSTAVTFDMRDWEKWRMG
jgi:hypothetical protein